MRCFRLQRGGFGEGRRTHGAQPFRFVCLVSVFCLYSFCCYYYSYYYCYYSFSYSYFMYIHTYTHIDLCLHLFICRHVSLYAGKYVCLLSNSIVHVPASTARLSIYLFINLSFIICLFICIHTPHTHTHTQTVVYALHELHGPSCCCLTLLVQFFCK